MLIGLKSTNFEGPAKRVGRRILRPWSNWPKDPIRYAVVIGAFFPDMVRETIRDQMAEAGLTEEDIRELLQKAEQKLEGASGTKH